VASPSGKKYHFTVLLEASLHPFSVGVARVSSGGAVLSTIKLFFFFFSPLLKITSWSSSMLIF
jgi:hypothetical protein